MSNNRQAQVCATISNDLWLKITSLADRNNRTTSQMVNLLLIQAVKERSRKRKNVKAEDIE